MMFGHLTTKLQVSGVGLFAGVPYLCAYQLGSYISCMEAPSLVNTNLLIAGLFNIDVYPTPTYYSSFINFTTV